MNVFIVEDAPQTRKKLTDLLGGESGLEVVGTSWFGTRGTPWHRSHLSRSGHFRHFAA